MTKLRAVCLAFALLSASIAGAKSEQQTKQIDEVVGLMELKKPYLDRDIWLKNAEKLKKIILEKDFSEDEFVTLLNQLIRSAGVPGPTVLIEGSFHYLQMIKPEINFPMGLFAQKRGHAFYVKYVLNPKLELKRGDRLEAMPLNVSHKHPLSLTVKRTPLETAMNHVISYDKRPLKEALYQYSYQSIAAITVDEKLFHYIHILDCSQESLPLVDTWSAKAKKGKTYYMIDLRDSFCLDGAALAAKLRSRLAESEVIVLQNQGTRLGAEDFIRNLRKSLKTQLKTMGEASAGFSVPREAKKLSNGNLWLYIPDRKEVLSPLSPDVPIKDSYMYAQGKDDLLNEAFAHVSQSSH